MNELLHRMLLEARLREADVAARLGVDPKTVRRWVNGRVPHRHNRAAIADLLGAEEADLWPGASSTLTSHVMPAELVTVYPHREAVPREVWIRLFSSAEREIGILAYSALFFAEDRGFLQLLADKARGGVTVRIALEDPEALHGAEHGEEEGVGDATAAAVRNALELYRALNKVENIEVRLHEVVLYNSIYRADEQLLINQYAYGVSAPRAPVFWLRGTRSGQMAELYVDAFERVWARAAPVA